MPPASELAQDSPLTSIRSVSDVKRILGDPGFALHGAAHSNAKHRNDGFAVQLQTLNLQRACSGQARTEDLQLAPGAGRLRS